METYHSLTGRRHDLSTLSHDERKTLDEILALFRRRPSWEEFAAKWISVARKKAWAGQKKTPVESLLYQLGQDLELRLGVAEGRVARPDYRDRIAGLIEERFGSRYAFCKKTGIDQGNLSHVLAGRKHFSPETLARALEALGVHIELVERGDVLAHDPLEADDRSERLRQLDHWIAVLENLAAKAKECAPEKRVELIGDPGLFPDDLDRLRQRTRNGESFDTALNDELHKALGEKATLARKIADAAEKKREQHARAAS